MIFKQGCGQRCNYAVILPLLEKQKEKTYEDVVKINTKNQVIACMSYDPESFLVLKNYSNEKEIIIKEDDICPAVNPIECIDSCFFRGSYFIIYWQGSKWNIESPDNKMQKIKIPY